MFVGLQDHIVTSPLNHNKPNRVFDQAFAGKCVFLENIVVIFGFGQEVDLVTMGGERPLAMILRFCTSIQKPTFVSITMMKRIFVP